MKSDKRLKDAFDRVAVPPELEKLVRSRIDSETAHRKTAGRLRQAVESTPAPAFLEARIRNSVQARSTRPRWTLWMAPVTALTLILAVSGVAYRSGHLRFTRASQEAYIASVSGQLPALLRVGLGDHLHCSVFRKLPAKPPTTEEFLRKMNPKFAGLIPIVRSQMPARYRLMQAHECRYRGRRFVHLSLADSSNLMSLIITQKGAGESFQANEMLPQLAASNIPMYRVGVQRFQITAFETHEYLAYFVSDLPSGQNSDMMLALGPRVREYLAKLEL